MRRDFSFWNNPFEYSLYALIAASLMILARSLISLTSNLSPDKLPVRGVPVVRDELKPGGSVLELPARAGAAVREEGNDPDIGTEGDKEFIGAEDQVLPLADVDHMLLLLDPKEFCWFELEAQTSLLSNESLKLPTATGPEVNTDPVRLRGTCEYCWEEGELLPIGLLEKEAKLSVLPKPRLESPLDCDCWIPFTGVITLMRGIVAPFSAIVDVEGVLLIDIRLPDKFGGVLLLENALSGGEIDLD